MSVLRTFRAACRAFIKVMRDRNGMPTQPHAVSRVEPTANICGDEAVNKAATALLDALMFTPTGIEELRVMASHGNQRVAMSVNRHGLVDVSIYPTGIRWLLTPDAKSEATILIPRQNNHTLRPEWVAEAVVLLNGNATPEDAATLINGLSRRVARQATA